MVNAQLFNDVRDTLIELCDQIGVPFEWTQFDELAAENDDHFYHFKSGIEIDREGCKKRLRDLYDEWLHEEMYKECLEFVR